MINNEKRSHYIDIDTNEQFLLKFEKKTIKFILKS